MGLPWWYIGKESTCKCRGHGFDPWFGKIPYAMEKISLAPQVMTPCATTAEACKLSGPQMSLCAVTIEALMTRARVPQQEKPRQ